MMEKINISSNKQLLKTIVRLAIVGPPAFSLIIYCCIFVALISKTGTIEFPTLDHLMLMILIKLSILASIGLMINVIWLDIQRRRKAKDQTLD